MTETHPDEYYFERIDVFDNALIRSFFANRGPGSLLYGEVTRRPVAPFVWKNAKFIGRGSEE